MPRHGDVKLYVGNLPGDVRTSEVRSIFKRYDSIGRIDVHNGVNGCCFAFLEFSDSYDAKKAISDRDGYNFDGYRIRVEYQKSQDDSRRDSYRRGRYDDDRSDRRGAYGRKGAPPKRSDHRVYVSGLPATGSWQDIKDHVRRSGEVLYADVYKDGTGVIEFSYEDDARRAVKELDGSKFRSHEGESSVISLKMQKSSGRHDSSVSSPRSYRSSPSRSPPNRKRRRSSSRSSRSRSPSSSRGRKSRDRSVSVDRRRRRSVSDDRDRDNYSDRDVTPKRGSDRADPIGSDKRDDVKRASRRSSSESSRRGRRSNSEQSREMDRPRSRHSSKEVEQDRISSEREVELDGCS